MTAITQPLTAIPFRTRSQITPLRDISERVRHFEGVDGAGSFAPEPDAVFSFPRAASSKWKSMAARGAMVLATACVLASAYQLVQTAFAPSPAVVKGPYAAIQPAPSTPSHEIIRIETPVKLSAAKLAPAKEMASDISTMVVSAQGVKMLHAHEGYRLKSYKDVKGVWTIGYGHTGLMPDGRPLGANMVISPDEAEHLFMDDVNLHADGMKRLLPGVTLTQSQFNGLLDFVYNKGVDAFEKSRLREEILNGNFLSAADEFLRWTVITKKEGGQIVVEEVPHLAQRAATHKQLFSDGFAKETMKIMESHRLKLESVDLQVLRTSQSLAPVKFTTNIQDMVSQLDRASKRATDHAQALERRSTELDRYAGNLTSEGKRLANKARSLPGAHEKHITAEHAAEMLDYNQRIGVNAYILKVKTSQSEIDRGSHKYYADLANMGKAVSQSLADAARLGTSAPRNDAEQMRFVATQDRIEEARALLSQFMGKYGEQPGFPSAKAILSADSLDRLSVALVQADRILEKSVAKYASVANENVRTSGVEKTRMAVR